MRDHLSTLLGISCITLLALSCSGGDGERGEDGSDGASCAATQQEDGSVIIQCGEDDPITIPAPADGEDGLAGEDGKPGKPGEDGGPGEDGEPGMDGEDGASIAVRTEVASMDKCPAGGMTVYLGPDTDGDGELSESEQTRAFAVCDGEDGLDSGDSPPQSLIRVDDAPEQSCPDGGKTVAIGVDTDRNGKLDSNEVTSAFDVCNGSDGMNGTGGTPGGALVFKVSAGGATTCGAAGGTLFAMGVDDNKDGNLDVSEVDAQFDVCDGADGSPGADGADGHTSLVSTAEEPPGINCAGGGTRIVVGVDANDNGVLDANEINTSMTSYVCSASTDLDGGYIQLDTHSDHTCGVKSSGEVWCWGRNSHGQLGNGTEAPSATPRRVIGLPSPATRVEVGDRITCALTDAHEVWCWGDNSNAIVENPTSTSSFSTPALRHQNTKQLSVGSDHACRVTLQGKRECWGSSTYGKTASGNNSLARIHIDHVVAGADHSCALLLDGEVWCWGRNQSGQLGNGTTTNSSTPVRVDLDEVVVKLVAGLEHTCALLDTQEVICWGDDSQGQLGLGAGASSTSSPMSKAINITKAIDIASGDHTVCVLSDAGIVACWGREPNNPLTRGTTSTNATVVSAITKPAGIATQVTVGSSVGCIALQDGDAQCWGDNTRGAIGDGTYDSAKTATHIYRTSDRFVDLTASKNHACGVKDSGDVYCWGENSQGQLGNISTTDSTSLVGVVGLGQRARQVAAGSEHTCAILDDASVKCWGNNLYGQLGDGSTFDSLAPVSAVITGAITKLAAGRSHTCALRDTGAMFCWGRNNHGQLGTGNFNDADVATLVANISGDVTDIAVGDDHTCAIALGGGVYCWGRNNSGQLGRGAGSASNTPSKLTFPNSPGRAISLTAGDAHTCATFEGGELFCWGKNTSGQLTLDMTSTSESTPQFAGTANGSRLIAGQAQTCLFADQSTVCWGASPQTSTVDFAPYSGALDLGAGDGFACILTLAGWIRCEGKGTRLGVGAQADTDFLMSVLE